MGDSPIGFLLFSDYFELSEGGNYDGRVVQNEMDDFTKVWSTILSDTMAVTLTYRSRTNYQSFEETERTYHSRHNADADATLFTPLGCINPK